MKASDIQIGSRIRLLSQQVLGFCNGRGTYAIPGVYIVEGLDELSTEVTAVRLEREASLSMFTCTLSSLDEIIGPWSDVCDCPDRGCGRGWSCGPLNGVKQCYCECHG